MTSVEEAVESFAVPPDPDVEIRTECRADRLDMGETDTAQVAPLDPRTLRGRDARVSAKVRLAPSTADSQGAERSSDANAVHRRR